MANGKWELNERQRITLKQGNSREIVREAIEEGKNKEAFGSRRVDCVPGE